MRASATRSMWCAFPVDAWIMPRTFFFRVRMRASVLSIGLTCVATQTNQSAKSGANLSASLPTIGFARSDTRELPKERPQDTDSIVIRRLLHSCTNHRVPKVDGFLTPSAACFHGHEHQSVAVLSDESAQVAVSGQTHRTGHVDLVESVSVNYGQETATFRRCCGIGAIF